MASLLLWEDRFFRTQQFEKFKFLEKIISWRLVMKIDQKSIKIKY